MTEQTKYRIVTKKEALEILMLLSAVESWSFSTGKTMPDYLHERLLIAVEVLSDVAITDI